MPTVTPLHLTGQISGSLRLAKACPALPEPAQPSAPPPQRKLAHRRPTNPGCLPLGTR